MSQSTLYVVASGSAANCYILTAGEDRLVLEAGISEKLLLKALNYDIDKVAGVLVSHRHNDHAKYISQYAKFFSVYGNKDTQLTYWDINPLEPKKRYKIGNFEVMPLEVEHGVPNFAYLINHEQTGWVLFCTDCVSFPYKLKDINPTTLLIESNWVEEVMMRNSLDGEDIRSQVDMHMELGDTIAAVKRLQNPLLANIILCHLSARNVDRGIMRERFEQELGITPQFAIKGAMFDINQYDF